MERCATPEHRYTANSAASRLAVVHTTSRCPRLLCAGLYGLELASRFPRSTIVNLEPNRTLWMQHVKLARAARRPNLACLHNPLTEEVAEALAHSNEFLDAQLVLSLHTARSFDHGVSVKDKMVRRLQHQPCRPRTLPPAHTPPAACHAFYLIGAQDRLDKFVGYILSLAKRTLLLLPAAPTGQCNDNRLASWTHAEPSDSSVEDRLQKAAKTYGARVDAELLRRGQTLDGCMHELWEVTLLSMTRLNRHHFCLGGCKTHTRRSYQMAYSVSSSGRGVMNMTNVQTSRHIPFETVTPAIFSHRATPCPPASAARASLACACRVCVPRLRAVSACPCRSLTRVCPRVAGLDEHAFAALAAHRVAIARAAFRRHQPAGAHADVPFAANLPRPRAVERRVARR